MKAWGEVFFFLFQQSQDLKPTELSLELLCHRNGGKYSHYTSWITSQQAGAHLKLQPEWMKMVVFNELQWSVATWRGRNLQQWSWKLGKKYSNCTRPPINLPLIGGSYCKFPNFTCAGDAALHDPAQLHTKACCRDDSCHFKLNWKLYFYRIKSRVKS